MLKYFRLIGLALLFSVGVGSLAQAENHSSGDPVVKEAQTILKNLGYEVGIIDGKYGRKTEGALKKFFKNLSKSYDGSLDTEELKILRDNPGNANATGKDYRICNGNFCTTQWGAWITKTSEDKFDEEVWNKYWDYADAHARINDYLFAYQNDISRELLRDGKNLLKQYPKNFYCKKRDGFTGKYSRLYFGPNTQPGRMNQRTGCEQSIIYMSFPKLVFKDYQCVWHEGGYYHDNCFFQWIHENPSEKELNKREMLVRVRMTFPSLNTDKLYHGDLLLISGEVSNFDPYQPDVEISKLTKITKTAEMPVKFLDLREGYLGEGTTYEEASVFEILKNLTGEGNSSYLTGFYYDYDLEQNYSKQIYSKLATFKKAIKPKPFNRKKYVQKVLLSYEAMIACAQNGLLGEFSASYVKSKFRNSPLNDLSSEEMNSLSQYEKNVIRTMVQDGETCGALQFGLLLDPNAIDGIFTRE